MSTYLDALIFFSEKYFKPNTTLTEQTPSHLYLSNSEQDFPQNLIQNSTEISTRSTLNLVGILIVKLLPRFVSQRKNYMKLKNALEKKPT